MPKTKKKEARKRNPRNIFMALFSCENLFVFVNYYDSHILHIMPHSPPYFFFLHCHSSLLKLHRKKKTRKIPFIIFPSLASSPFFPPFAFFTIIMTMMMMIFLMWGVYLIVILLLLLLLLIVLSFVSSFISWDEFCVIVFKIMIKPWIKNDP